ncbi:MAG: 3'(2'),5'-bisphosphate nucleotidase CysQ [Salinarimonadaceae bacterium]|nr:MAG: 3'(2'),5'-bisphosphate nucleotidase CysQ [Salinarimonadaceae bacterium]
MRIHPDAIISPSESSLAEAISEIAAPLHEIAREAGGIANRYFRPGATTSARIWAKDGGSPVTEADVSVDAFLKIRLSQLAPDAAWLSEETADNPVRLDADLVWIVDPIDGTRAFLSGHPDWSVSIALLARGAPVLAVVYAPALETFYEARAGAGAFADGAGLAVSTRPTLREARVSGPQSMADALARSVGPVSRLPRIPSLALRIARVAAGDVDIGLVTRNARDWDIAAADLILREAGGVLSDDAGSPPVYNRPDPVHGELFAAAAVLHPGLIEAMTSPQGRIRAV